MKKIGFLMLFVLLSGCATKQFDAALYQVELGNNVQPSESIKQGHNGKVSYYSYEDENIRSSWNVNTKSIEFTMFNKTDKTIKVIWNDAVYVDIFNTAYRVIHKGIKYIDAGKSVPPSIIIKQSQIVEIILPADSVSYNSSAGWLISPLLQDFTVSEESVDKMSDESVKKTVKVYLPLQVNDKILEYIFTFSVDGIQVKQNTETGVPHWKNKRANKWEK